MNVDPSIVNLVGVLAWPVTVLVIFLSLRIPLLKLVPLLQKLKYKDFEMEFRETLRA